MHYIFIQKKTIMSFSGARGSTSQLHQLVGLRGLMSHTPYIAPSFCFFDLPVFDPSLLIFIISEHLVRMDFLFKSLATFCHVQVQVLKCFIFWSFNAQNHLISLKSSLHGDFSHKSNEHKVDRSSLN